MTTHRTWAAGAGPATVISSRSDMRRMTGAMHRREVRCPRCGWWWHHPKEPIHFGDWDEWWEEHPERESLSCPNCGEVVEVSGKNTRFSRVGSPESGSGKKKGRGT